MYWVKENSDNYNVEKLITINNIYKKNSLSHQSLRIKYGIDEFHLSKKLSRPEYSMAVDGSGTPDWDNDARNKSSIFDFDDSDYLQDLKDH